MIDTEIFHETLRGFFAPVQAYLDDSSVSEILINGPADIYVERRGRLERVEEHFDGEEAVECALRNLAQFVGKRIDAESPILEARFPDGSRVQAVVPPVAESACVSIRRFQKSSFSLSSLVEREALSSAAASVLTACVRAKLNILVAGGTGSGKTSLLNALSRAIPSDSRVLVLEDSREVQVQRDHVVSLETRPPDPRGHGGISMRELFRASLRMRPDRIVIGEIRGQEALDLVQAMVSGHGGCLSTLHATHPHDTLARLETLALMSDVRLPHEALRSQIGSGVDLLVQVARHQDGFRGVTHITEVTGYDAAQARYELRDLFRRGSGAGGAALRPTGLTPHCLERLQAAGRPLPDCLLRPTRDSTEQHGEAL